VDAERGADTLGEYDRQDGIERAIDRRFDVPLGAGDARDVGAAGGDPRGRRVPAYLDSSIKSIYERAGVLQTNDGTTGSLTMIGTVSPAGGNFDEPVPQSALATVTTVLGPSAARAYKRFSPAVDPLISWSPCADQLRPFLDARVREAGVSLDDFVPYQNAVPLDMVYVQQEAFDPVDASTPRERQTATFGLLRGLLQREYRFANRDEARAFFTQLTGLIEDLNYTAQDAPDHATYLAQIEEQVRSLGRRPDATADHPAAPSP
jgi:V/A-type H+-transporting ATPase subunit A